MPRKPTIPADNAKAWRAEARRQKKGVQDLTNAVTHAINQMEVLMKQPSTVERGRAIAKVLNELDLANDTARHFLLDVPLKKLKEGKVQ